jgi:hypothetical protein
VGVSFAVTGLGFHPDPTLYFTGYQMGLPTEVKTPLAIGMKAVLQTRLRQFRQPDLVQEHIVPIDLAAPDPFLATTAEFYTLMIAQMF